MTLGSRKNDKGQKELLLILSQDEIPNFEDGKPVVKRSGDKFGEFDVTVVVTRKLPIHPDAKEGFHRMDADGQYIYRGFTIVSDGIGYKTEECDNKADTLNELLHNLDTHPAYANDSDLAYDMVHTRKGEYKGHTIEIVGKECMVDNRDGTFYASVLDALHAIDRGERD